jgi:transcriptional regulator with XRE-family HTH domain
MQALIGSTTRCVSFQPLVAIVSGMSDAPSSSQFHRAVGLRLAAARVALGRNQEELATELHCTASAISNYENGSRKFPPESAVRLMRLHGVDLMWIYAGVISIMRRDLQDQVFSAATKMGAPIGSDDAPVAMNPPAKRRGRPPMSLHEDQAPLHETPRRR